MKEKKKRIIIGISTIILIIFMITFIDIRIILQNINKISFYGILLFIIIYTTTFLTRSYRLKFIFQGLNLKTSYMTLFGSFGVGWGINEITPGKIGDLARIEFIHEKENGVSLSKSICGITLERFIDLIILILFTCITLVYLYLNNIRGTTDLNLHFYIGFGVIIVLGGVITLIIFILKTNWLLNLIGKISIRLRNLVERFLRKFLEGLNDFNKNKKNILKVIILSIPTWFFETFTLILLFYLIGYEINIFIIILAQLITFFTKTFPITPGGWFVSESVGALLIYLFYPSIPYNILLSIFFLDHLLRTVYVLIYGTSSALIFNFKFSKIDFKQLDENKIDEKELINF